MENQRKAWIHCRVSKEPLRSLLDFQAKKAKQFCESKGIEVFAVSKEVGGGRSATEYYLSTISIEVRRGKINCIVVYDASRLLIFDDSYIEFKMFCDMYGVEIITIENEKIKFPTK